MLPSPPPGSVFTIHDAGLGQRLTWSGRGGGGPLRFLMIAFMVFWLCGWAFGEVMAIRQVLLGIGGGADLFLLIWLGGWTCGGVFAMFLMVKIVRPGRPDSLQFESTRVTYLPGRKQFNPSVFNPWDQMQRYKDLLTKSRPHVIEKASPEVFKLERLGDRQRLAIDVDSDRVEIGADLREPEREWLFAVLTQWKSS